MRIKMLTTREVEHKAAEKRRHAKTTLLEAGALYDVVPEVLAKLDPSDYLAVPDGPGLAAMIEEDAAHANAKRSHSSSTKKK